MFFQVQVDAGLSAGAISFSSASREPALADVVGDGLHFLEPGM